MTPYLSISAAARPAALTAVRSHPGHVVIDGTSLPCTVVFDVFQ
jgi:hypothetical protein